MDQIEHITYGLITQDMSLCSVTNWFYTKRRHNLEINGGWENLLELSIYVAQVITKDCEVINN